MDRIQQIRDVLSKNKLVLFAYLFGSRALNRAGNMSDWDIAVYIHDEKLETNPVWQKIKLEDEISCILKTDKVQVTILNNLDAPLFLYNIINDGVLLAEENSEIRIAFEYKVLRRFHDWRYYLDRHMSGDKCR